MNRNTLNLLVNVLSFFSFLVSTASGLVLWQILPLGYGYRGGRGVLTELLFLGLGRPDWLRIHNISSLIFVVLIVFHIALHWSWVKNLPRKFGHSR